MNEKLDRRTLLKNAIVQGAVGAPLFALSLEARERLNPPEEIEIEQKEWLDRVKECEPHNPACFSRAQELDLDEIPVFLGTLLGGALLANASINIRAALTSISDESKDSSSQK